MRSGYWIISALFFFGCGSDVVPRPPGFVVEGFITAGEPVNNIRVKGTSPIDSINVTSDPVTTASITLSNSTSVFDLIYNPDVGLYESQSDDLSIDIGETYVLNVIVGEREATAETTVPTAPEGLKLADSILTVPKLGLSFRLRDEIADLFFTERITLQWDSIPGQNYFVVIENRVDVIDPILPDGIPQEAQELLSSFRFISEPSEIPRFEIIGIALDTYGRYVAKVFTVNEEYADLFDNLEQDSRDLNEPPSNVMNAQGIFTAFASDSIFFEVKQP